jgi:hypothetical protein
VRGRGGAQGAPCMRALASARRRQIPLVPYGRGFQCARVARTTTFPPASHRHRPSAADRMDWASVESSRNRTGRVLLLITSSSPPIPTPASAPTQLLAGLARQQDEYPTQRPDPGAALVADPELDSPSASRAHWRACRRAPNWSECLSHNVALHSVPNTGWTAAASAWPSMTE